MRPHAPTVVSDAAVRVLAKGREAGVRGAAIDRASRMPFDRLLGIWERVARASADPLLPVEVARATKIEDLGPLGFVLMTAPTLGASLEHLARFGALVTDSGHWEMHTSTAQVAMRWHRRAPRTLGQRLAIESTIAHAVFGARELGGNEARPRRVSFTHAAPRDRARHEELFECEVAWSAAHDAVELDREIMDIVPRWASTTK